MTDGKKFDAFQGVICVLFLVVVCSGLLYCAVRDYRDMKERLKALEQKATTEVSK